MDSCCGTVLVQDRKRAKTVHVDLVHFLASRLASRSSPSGLWGHASFQFSTEASCFALLALAGVPSGTVVEACVRKLVRYQRADDLWPSTEGGSTGSAWATAIAAVTLLELSPSNTALRAAARALAQSKPQEASTTVS